MFRKYPHILLPIKPVSSTFTTTQGGGSGEKKIRKDLNPQEHSGFLKNKLDRAWTDTESEYLFYRIERNGIYLEFRGAQGFDLTTKSLDDLQSKKIRLLNIREEQKIVQTSKEIGEFQTETRATVFVANEKKEHFFKKIHEYATEVTDKGYPKHADLINSIADIRKADKIHSFWMDDKDLIPGEAAQWCEVWLNTEREEISDIFDTLLKKLKILTKPRSIKFPERIVKIVLVNRDQLGMLSLHSDDIAEYRRAKETASFWLDMENVDQTEWAEDLLDRLQISPDPDVAVCILDTGVNNGHLLLKPILSDRDCQTADREWGTHDHNKHGSLMAGIVGYGDIEACLQSSGPININHCLESVKIVPPPPEENKPELWGDVTARAIAFADFQNPRRKRIVCMAISATDTRDRGVPTSWSAQLDQLASGSLGDPQRLLIVCAGNLNDLATAKEYPHVPEDGLELTPC